MQTSSSDQLDAHAASHQPLTRRCCMNNNVCPIVATNAHNQEENALAQAGLANPVQELAYGTLCVLHLQGKARSAAFAPKAHSLNSQMRSLAMLKTRPLVSDPSLASSPSHKSSVQKIRTCSHNPTKQHLTLPLARQLQRQILRYRKRKSMQSAD